MICIKFHQKNKKPKKPNFWTFEVLKVFKPKNLGFRNYFPALAERETDGYDTVSEYCFRTVVSVLSIYTGVHALVQCPTKTFLSLIFKLGLRLELGLVLRIFFVK